MSIVLTDDTYYQDIANAIRSKNGTTTQYKPSEMAAAINAISGGGDINITLLKDSDGKPGYLNDSSPQQGYGRYGLINATSASSLFHCLLFTVNNNKFYELDTSASIIIPTTDTFYYYRICGVPGNSRSVDSSTREITFNSNYVAIGMEKHANRYNTGVIFRLTFCDPYPDNNNALYTALVGYFPKIGYGSGESQRYYTSNIIYFGGNGTDYQDSCITVGIDSTIGCYTFDIRLATSRYGGLTIYPYKVITKVINYFWIDHLFSRGIRGMIEKTEVKKY